jgi:hypothetical protein
VGTDVAPDRFVVVGVLVVGQALRLWRGRREIEFSAEGLLVREVRGGDVREMRYDAARILNLRPTYPGWRETLLFDYDGRPIGIELPLTSADRERLLRHPAARQFFL